MNERPADTIYVGNAPVMSYVADALHILNVGGRLVLKARGNAIRYAVDVEEILRQRYFRNGMSSAVVTLSTEQVPNERRGPDDDRDSINLSAIEVVVSVLLPSQQPAKPAPTPPPTPEPKTLIVKSTGEPPRAFVPTRKQPPQTVNPPRRKSPRGEGQGQ